MAARDFPAAAGDLSGLVRQNSREIARLIPWEISQNTLRHPRGDLPAAKFRRMRSPGNDISKETAAWNPPGNAGVVRRKIMRLPGEPPWAGSRDSREIPRETRHFQGNQSPPSDFPGWRLDSVIALQCEEIPAFRALNYRHPPPKHIPILSTRPEIQYEFRTYSHRRLNVPFPEIPGWAPPHIPGIAKIAATKFATPLRNQAPNIPRNPKKQKPP